MSRRMSRLRSWTVPRVATDRALTLITAGALLTATAVLFVRGRTTVPIASARAVPVPRTGTDTTALLFLSRTCPACTAEPGASSLRAWLDSLTQRPSRPKLVGVAIDDNAAAGIEYLTEVSDFDEVSAGDGWANAFAYDYVWNVASPVATVPQLIIVERTTVVQDSPFTVSSSETLLRRYVGLRPITEWVMQQARARR